MQNNLRSIGHGSSLAEPETVSVHVEITDRQTSQ